MPTSKQLSIISKQLKLNDFQFFIDRQIDGDDLFQLLSDAGMKVERHRDHFEHDADDDTWIMHAGSVHWVIITADSKIEDDHIEAICKSKAQVVILTDNTSGYPQWGAAIIAATQTILRNLLTKGRPLIMRVSRSGKVSTVRDSLAVETRRRAREQTRIIREKSGRT